MFTEDEEFGGAYICLHFLYQPAILFKTTYLFECVKQKLLMLIAANLIYVVVKSIYVIQIFFW